FDFSVDLKGFLPLAAALLRQYFLDELDVAINENTGKALAQQQVQLVGDLSSFSLPQWAGDHDPGSGRELIDPVDYLRHRVSFYFLTAYGGIRLADPGEQQLEVVVHFGGGSHGRARVTRIDFLFDRNSGRYTAYVVDVRFFHSPKELPGVGAEAFYIHALPFGKERIKGERRFTRARKARDHHEF